MSRDRDPGIEILVRFHAILRTGRAYSVTNQVFRQQLEAFVALLRPLIQAEGEIAFAAFEEGLYLNGTRISTRAVDFRHYRGMLEALTRRELGGVQILGDAPLEEWQTFFELFLQPERYRGADFVQACRERGLRHVVPALFTSLDPPAGDAGEGDPAAANGAAATAAPEKTPPEADPQSPAPKPAGGTAGGRPAADPNLAGRPGAAPKRYAQAVAGLRSLLTSTTLQQGLEIRHVKRVVQPIVDEALEGKPVVIGLAGFGQRDEFTYARNVNASLIAVTIGHRLGLDRQALADLAVATLLHDTGRAATSDPARVGIESARRIAAVTRFSPTTLRCLEAALDGRVVGTGDGAAASGSLFARIVAIADAYSRLVTHRGDVGRSITPYQALGMILGPLATQFEPSLRVALVESLGIYPPGQLVEMDSGEIAAVLAPSGQDLARPIVRVVAGPAGAPLPARDFWEGGPVPPERWIRRALKAEEYPQPDDPAADAARAA